MIVAGHFSNDVNGNCTNCSFIARLTPAGDVDWVREPIYPADQCDIGMPIYRLAIADDDTLLVTGWPLTSDFGNGVRAASLSADATQVLWSDCHDEPTAFVYPFSRPIPYGDGGAIVLTTDELYEDGSFGDFLSVNAVATFYDQLGAVVWRRDISAQLADGSPAITRAGSVTSDSQGVIYISVYTDGELTLSASAGLEDTALVRLGADGINSIIAGKRSDTLICTEIWLFSLRFLDHTT